MKRTLAFAGLVLLFAVAPLSAAGIRGHYIEARTIDVWTGPCFANADVNIGGKHGIMAWKVDKGEFNKVNLNGLGVVAVVYARISLEGSLAARRT
ncbi:MAG: hypothetical protein ACRELG_04395, partial [Gemmataceae bacterium]